MVSIKHPSTADPSVLRFVSLSSRSGRYGGPSDSAYRQSAIVSPLLGLSLFVSGHLPDDRPVLAEASHQTVQLYECRPLVSRVPFPTLFGWHGLRVLWRSVGQVTAVHASYGRDIMPVLLTVITLVRGRRLVLQPHGMLTARTSRLHRLLDRLIVRPLAARADAIVALTETERDALETWLGSRSGPDLVVLHNPIIGLDTEIDPESITAVDGEALFVGRLHRRKRIDVFVDAAEIGAAAAWADRYVVVGPDEGDLDLVRASPNVSYEGSLPRDEVAQRVARCTVFVLPSLNEPWGNVVALALALGKAVIVTESAAIAPIILEYGAGVVVPDADPRGLADAVHRVLTDEDFRARLTAGAERLAAVQFSDDFQRRTLLDVYAPGAANTRESETVGRRQAG